MSSNRIRTGHTLTWVNGTGGAIVSAQAVLVGSKKLGIATTDIAVGATGELDMEGVFSLPKDAPGAGSGGAQGVDCNWNPTTKKVTAASNDGASPPVSTIRIGYFHSAAADADVAANVKLSES